MVDPSESTHFDVVIVGAGSAGCALAARLSEDPIRSVLLLEAGRHYPRLEDFPEELRHGNSLASSFPGHPDNWSMIGHLTPDLSYPIVRGKVVGGSSAVNGTLFTRGTPDDFNSWAAEGNDEWSWEKVLPYFIKLESDLDFDDAYHGTTGPMPVQRPKQDDLTAISEAFVAASLDAGHPYDRDLNAPTSDGVGLLPLNFVGGVRMNTALTYLGPILDRPNLTIRGQVTARRVLFDGDRATGVETNTQQGPRTFRGDEVVLSAGGIKTPHLLMLSGIGPPEMLRRQGIAVVHASNAVGQDFMDHPMMIIPYQSRARIPFAGNMPISQVRLGYTADGSVSTGDMHIFPSSYSMSTMLLRHRAGQGLLQRARASVIGRPLQTLKAVRGTSIRRLWHDARHRSDLSLICGLDLEESRGNMTLLSADPEVAPALNYNYMTESRDLDRMRECARIAAELLQNPAFSKLGSRRTAPDDATLASDRALGEWIMSRMGSTNHLSSSARMGTDADTSVVDQWCSVHGVQGLSIADVSIMPTLVRRGPHATAVMIGERAADLIAARIT